MQIEVIHQPNKLIARLTGELDEYSAVEVRKKLDWAIDLAVVQNFIFDFSGVTFMDSTGIGVLLGRYKKLKAKGMYVHITGASGHIDKILNTAGIYTIINKIAK